MALSFSVYFVARNQTNFSKILFYWNVIIGSIKLQRFNIIPKFVGFRKYQELKNLTNNSLCKKKKKKNQINDIIF